MAKPDRRDEREQLCRAALEVMRRSGYSNANITDILAEAGLGTRAFYRHFDSKDDLLLELFQDNARATRQRLKRRMATAGTPRDSLVAWIDELLDMAYNARRTARAAIFVSEAARAAFGSAGDDAAADLYEPLARVLEEGVEAGAFPLCDPTLDAASIHAITWRFFWAAVHGKPDADRATARAHILRFALPAIGASEVD